MTRRLALVLTLCGGLLALAAPAYAADIFLKVSAPELKGESIDQQFKDAIEVQSYGWGVVALSGRASFSSLFITKAVDRSSPGFMQALGSGKRSASARLSLRHPGANPFVYLEYCAENVAVVSQQAGAGGADPPTEAIELQFTKFEQRYVYRDSAGQETVYTSGWDSDLNAPAPFNPTCGT
jgi:type VI secretion system secreted protein Hcp